MRNVDGKRFAFALVFRALALGVVVGAAVGITALVAPAAIPAVALWSGIGAGTVWAGSIVASIGAANRDANIDWECRDLYELPKPSLWSRLEMSAYDALENVFSRDWKQERQDRKAEKQAKISTKSKLDGLKQVETEKQDEHQVDAPVQQQNDPQTVEDDGPSCEV